MKRSAKTPRRTLRVVGLFAGIGGIELGLHRAGHTSVLLCENDPGAQAVLRKRFLGVRLHDDIRTLGSLPQGTDLVAAGFPCQDLSQAGKTAGLEGARSGLVGEVFRLLRRQRVPWVLLENVPFMLHISGGRAMDVIVESLEELGYRWAYRVVDSRSFGLPQRRERVYLLASRREDPRPVLFSDEHGQPPIKLRRSDVAHGFYWTEGSRGLGWAVDAIPTLKGGSSFGIPSSPAILQPDGTIVTPDIRDAERLQGFPANWTKPAGQVVRDRERWKLTGNAVTVHVARWIGARMARTPIETLEVNTSSLGAGEAWPRAAWNVGAGRFRVDASSWPLSERAPSLVKFLQYPTTPLSAKATAGFLSRARASTRLIFTPGFLDSVQRHLDVMYRKAIDGTGAAGSTEAS